MSIYQNSKIYKIVNDTNDKIYYGSTTQKYLCSRMAQHRGNYNKTTSKLLGDLKTCKIILVENYPCNTKDELSKRERYFVENFECVNKQLPGRKKEEYYLDTREVQIKNHKNYYHRTKNKLREKIKCECGTTVQKISLLKHKKTKKHLTYLSSCTE